MKVCEILFTLFFQKSPIIALKNSSKKNCFYFLRKEILKYETKYLFKIDNKNLFFEIYNSEKKQKLIERTFYILEIIYNIIKKCYT